MRKLNNLIDRILYLDVNAKCTIRGDDYDTLEWHSGNLEAPPTFAECAAVTDVQINSNIRQKTIDVITDKLSTDPIFATIAAEVVKLKAAADGTTTIQARNALLADLASRIS